MHKLTDLFNYHIQLFRHSSIPPIQESFNQITIHSNALSRNLHSEIENNSVGMTAASVGVTSSPTMNLNSIDPSTITLLPSTDVDIPNPPCLREAAQTPDLEVAGRGIPSQKLSISNDNMSSRVITLEGFGDDFVRSIEGNAMSSTLANPVENVLLPSVLREISNIPEEREEDLIHSTFAQNPVEGEAVADTNGESRRRPTVVEHRWNEVLRERTGQLCYKNTQISIPRNRTGRNRQGQEAAGELNHAMGNAIGGEPNLSLAYLQELNTENENENDYRGMQVTTLEQANIFDVFESEMIPRENRIGGNIQQSDLEVLQTDLTISSSQLTTRTESIDWDSNNKEEYKQFVLNNLEDLTFIMDNAEIVYDMIKARQRFAMKSRTSSPVRRFDPKVLLNAPIENLEIRRCVIKALICHRAIDFTRIEGITDRKSVAQAFSFVMELRSVGFINLAEDGRKISLVEHFSNRN